MSPEDISILGHFVLKEGREEEGLKIIKELVETTWAEDEGCICYYFYLKQDSQREGVFHERWRDNDALQAHLKRLQDVYGAGAVRERFEKMDFEPLKAIV